MPRLSLLSRFAVVSLALTAILGVALGAAAQQVITSRTIEDAERSALVATRAGVQPNLRVEDLTRDFVPLTADRRAELDAALAGATSAEGVVRIKLWNRQHWIVWSDNPTLIGRWFPGDDTIEGAFAGDITSEISDLTSPEEFEERDFGELLAVYVPLRAEGDQFTADPSAPVVGAFEIYLPYTPIAAAIEKDTFRLWIIIAVGLTVLYLALYRLVASASSRLRKQAEENRYLALHDTLTGLPNRTLFRDRADQAILQAQRRASRLAVLLLDLDRFKLVNDTLGHRHGDLLLQQLGERMESRLRSSDTIARFGGDELAILLLDVNTPQDARRVANDLSAALEEPFLIEGLDLDVRASIGVAVYPDHGEDSETLIQRADVAMYAAKSHHSGIEMYSAEHDHYSPERLALATEIRRALERDELILHYQPKLDLRTGQVTCVEALVRWQHPERGLLLPGNFIPVLETTDLMKPLTLRVIDMALERCRAWQDAGRPMNVSVNVSAVSVHDLGLVAAVERLLRDYDLHPSVLEFELTESALLTNPARAELVLQRLHNLGIRISVDDFGTGYASLAYLRQLPVDELKIDRSFIMNLEDAPEDAVIVDFSIGMGRSLGLEIVAEGVESPAVLQRLVDMGCDYAQGFHLSPALDPADLLPWLDAFDASTATPTGSRRASRRKATVAAEAKAR